MKNVTLKINNTSVTVPEGTRILDAARQAGYDIPTLCYLKDLTNEGSCRMCVVEVKGARSLVVSCVGTVAEGILPRSFLPVKPRSNLCSAIIKENVFPVSAAQIANYRNLRSNTDATISVLRVNTLT